MRLAIVFALAMLATAAWPCSKPDGLTLFALMQYPTWTVRTGSTSSAEAPPEDGVDATPTPMSSPSRTAKVAIAMPAIGRGDEAFRCLTWDVELILPPGIGLKTDDGNPGATKYTGLESTATAEFDLALPAPRQNEVLDWQAWLRVKVRFPSDDAGVFLSHVVLPGTDEWLYPVTVQMASGSTVLGPPLAYAGARTQLPAFTPAGIGPVPSVLAGDQP